MCQSPSTRIMNGSATKRAGMSATSRAESTGLIAPAAGASRSGGSPAYMPMDHIHGWPRWRDLFMSLRSKPLEGFERQEFLLLLLLAALTPARAKPARSGDPGSGDTALAAFSRGALVCRFGGLLIL